ncbi:MAG: GtrA family protein [Tardiphaga sp.]|nr:GtrA family protein [Tardiphaga sp.]
MRSVAELIARCREPGALRMLLRSRPVRFIAIGIVNTIFGYAVFTGLYLVSGNHRLSIIGATIVGVIFNFFTTGRIVFGSSDNRLILRFVAGYAISLGVNLVLLEVLVRLGVNALIAQLISLPPVVVLTYFVNARLVFRNVPPRGAGDNTL